jgi:hypothetical protein
MNEKQVPQVTMMQIEAMEPAARRVMIAKDVLNLLDAQAIAAERGHYIQEYLPTVGVTNDTQMNVVVEGWLARQRACDVCALGAAMLAAVRRFDDLTVGPFVDKSLFGPGTRPNYVEYLGRFFPKEQLDLIESAFEGEDIFNLLSEEDAERAVAFYKQYADTPYHEYADDDDVEERGSTPESNRRLRAIFENIVANNGEFIP